MNKKECVQGLTSVFSYVGMKKIPVWEKIIVIGFVLAYIISPIDLIPDIPVIGWLDDIGVGALFIAFCSYRVNQLHEKHGKEEIDVTPADPAKGENKHADPADSEK